jgi:hypothetical protein
VIIRDISINGAGSGTNGIRFLAGKTLMVDHCWIYGMTTRGIDVSLTNNGNLKVLNTVIENVGEDGIHMTTTAGLVVAAIDNTQIMNCGQDGIEAVTNVRGEITRSGLVICNSNGILTSGTNVQLNLDDTLVAHCNVTGIKGSAGSSLRVSDSIIANNSTGIFGNGGTIDSFQGNSLIGNPTPGSFTTATPKQ